MFFLEKKNTATHTKRAYIISTSCQAGNLEMDTTVCESQRDLLTQIDRDIMDSVRGTTTDPAVIVINGSHVKIEDANDVLC